MSSRSEALAATFVQANDDLAAVIREMPADDWHKLPAGEQRTVGVVAHHTASGYLPLLSFAQMMGNGQPLPHMAPGGLDELNAREAAVHANTTKEEVLGLLEANCHAVTAGLGAMTDGQLDTVADFFGQQVTVEGMIRGVLIGHTLEHVESIKAVMGG